MNKTARRAVDGDAAGAGALAPAAEPGGTVVEARLRILWLSLYPAERGALISLGAPGRGVPDQPSADDLARMVMAAKRAVIIGAQCARALERMQ